MAHLLRRKVPYRCLVRRFAFYVEGPRYWRLLPQGPQQGNEV